MGTMITIEKEFDLFTEDDILPGSHNDNFTGKWVVLDMKTSLENHWMKAEYANKLNQLYFASSGFGCDPNKMGRKIFGIFASDFDNGYITCREEILGIAKPETIEEWKRLHPEVADHIEKIEKQER